MTKPTTTQIRDLIQLAARATAIWQGLEIVKNIGKPL